MGASSAVVGCGRAWAGVWHRATGNTLFSFPFQKTGHSRRFGRFTHGALSYRDPAPPAALECTGMGPSPITVLQRDSEQRLAASCQPPKRGLSQPGAPIVPQEAGLLLALQFWFIRCWLSWPGWGD